MDLVREKEWGGRETEGGRGQNKTRKRILR